MSQQYLFAAMQTNHIPSCTSNSLASRQSVYFFLLSITRKLLEHQDYFWAPQTTQDIYSKWENPLEEQTFLCLPKGRANHCLLCL